MISSTKKKKKTPCRLLRPSLYSYYCYYYYFCVSFRFTERKNKKLYSRPNILRVHNIYIYINVSRKFVILQFRSRKSLRIRIIYFQLPRTVWSAGIREKIPYGFEIYSFYSHVNGTGNRYFLFLSDTLTQHTSSSQILSSADSIDAMKRQECVENAI